VTVQIDHNPEESRYEALVGGNLAGFIQYQLRGERMTMVHAEVEPNYEGQGVGSELAKVALADVRERGLELVPLCPFIAGYVRRHRDSYLDLVAEPLREKVLAGG
jgi:predicted GNAT family acetyltransferase